MAERRMFAKTIIDSDAFLEMPISTRLLYYDLSMRADDDGFVNSPKKIMRMIGASQNDIDVLILKKFILPFENGIVVIKHWRIHNYIRKDTYNETPYKEEKSMLELDENKSYRFIDQKCIAVVDEPSTQVRLGKDSIDKVNIDKEKKKFIPPTLEEVKKYAKEKCPNVNAEDFYNYFTEGNWTDSKGNKVKSWKQKMLTWNSYKGGKQNGNNRGIAENNGKYGKVDLSKNLAKQAAEFDETGVF